MNILITGGAGFIGSNLISKLIDGNNITVLDDLSFGRAYNFRKRIDKDIDFIQCNTGYIENLEKDFDVIYHLGMSSSSPMYMKRKKLLINTVSSMKHVLDYTKEHGSKLVFASTSSLYNGNTVPYHENMFIHVTDFYTEARLYCERLSELYANMYNLDITALRLFSVYGSNEVHKGRYANMISQFIWVMNDDKQPVIYGDGEQTRDFIHVDDVINAFMIAGNKIQKGFDIYNVGSGMCYSFNEIVEMISAEIGKNIKPVYVPNPIRNYVADTLADTNKAQNKLKFKAEIPLHAGIKNIISSLYV